MVRKCLFGSFLFLYSFKADCQIRFDSTIGYLNNAEFANSVLVSSDSDYITSSFSENPSQTESGLLLNKSSQNGNLIWQTYYGKTGYLRGPGLLIKTENGGYASAGASGIGDTNRALLVKYNANGDTDFIRIYPDTSQELGALLENENNEYILVGLQYRMYPIHKYRDYLVIKTDSSGKIIWEKAYGDTLDEVASNPVELTNNKYVISGARTNFIVNHDDEYTYYPWFIWIDSLGNVIKQRTYQNYQAESGYIVTKGLNNRILFAINLDSTFPSYGQVSFPNLLIMDAKGNVIQRMSLPTLPQGEFSVAHQLPDSSIVAVGIEEDHVPLSGMIVKFNPNGTVAWLHEYANDSMYNFNYFSDFEPTPDHGFIVTGATSKTIGNVPTGVVWLVKLDSNGCLTNDCVNVNTGVHEVFPETTSFTIYPNPANGKVTIAYTLQNSYPGQIQVFNLLGQCVYQSNLLRSSAKLEINVSNWAKGVYEINLQSEGQSIGKSLVVQ